jgi:hypothetical protein
MSNRMLLRELAGDYKPVSEVVASLAQIMGRFERVGGNTRIYDVNGRKGAVYSVGQGTEGIGLVLNGSNVSNIYFWNVLDVDKEPDYEVVLPVNSDFHGMAPLVVDMIRKHTLGQVPLN